MSHYPAPVSLFMPLFNSEDFIEQPVSNPMYPGYPLACYKAAYVPNLAQNTTTIVASTGLSSYDPGTYLFTMEANVGEATFVSGFILFTIYLSASGAKTMEINQSVYVGNVSLSSTGISNSVGIVNISQSPAQIQVSNLFTSGQSNLNWAIIRF